MVVSLLPLLLLLQGVLLAVLPRPSLCPAALGAWAGGCSAWNGVDMEAAAAAWAACFRREGVPGDCPAGDAAWREGGSGLVLQPKGRGAGPSRAAVATAAGAAFVTCTAVPSTAAMTCAVFAAANAVFQSNAVTRAVSLRCTAVNGAATSCNLLVAATAGAVFQCITTTSAVSLHCTAVTSTAARQGRGVRSLAQHAQPTATAAAAAAAHSTADACVSAATAAIFGALVDHTTAVPHPTHCPAAAPTFRPAACICRHPRAHAS
eukprot:1158956-Pelagomonas_calceolata.AAC.4